MPRPRGTDHVAPKDIERESAKKTKSGGNLSRRAFLRVGAAAGGGLLLGFALPGLSAQMSAGAAEGDFAPNGFIRIGQDGRVAVIVPQVEMGQGNLHVLSDAGRRGT